MYQDYYYSTVTNDYYYNSTSRSLKWGPIRLIVADSVVCVSCQLNVLAIHYVAWQCSNNERSHYCGQRKCITIDTTLALSFLDYYFVTREEMKKAIDNNEFVEHAEFSGNIYGTR